MYEILQFFSHTCREKSGIAIVWKREDPNQNVKKKIKCSLEVFNECDKKKFKNFLNFFEKLVCGVLSEILNRISHYIPESIARILTVCLAIVSLSNSLCRMTVV